MRRPKFKVTITETLMRTVAVKLYSTEQYSIKEIKELTKVKKSTLYRNLPESKDK